MGEFERLLASELGWLERRVAGFARDREMRDELVQETVLIALDRAPRFFSGPSRDEHARMRYLLHVALRSARTNLLRQERKTQPAKGDELPEARDSQTPENLLEAKEWRRDHLLAVRSLLTPNVRLAYLLVHLPHEVTPGDLEDAAKFRKGGAAGLARPPDATWEILRRALEDLHPKATDAEWKRAVVEILRWDGPLGEAPSELVQNGIRNLDTQLTRARARLELAAPSDRERSP